MMLKCEVGDVVWIHIGGKGMSEGKVVHKFNLDWGSEFYVVQIETHIDPVLEIRDGLTVSDDPDKPIGFWRKENWNV